MSTTLTSCACGAEATANGRECGSCFRERLGSIQLDVAATPTRTRRNYYDAEPIHEVFGADAHERVMESTQGLGVAKPGPDGRFYHRDRKTKEIEPLSTEQIFDTYLKTESDE